MANSLRAMDGLDGSLVTTLQKRVSTSPETGKLAIPNSIAEREHKKGLLQSLVMIEKKNQLKSVNNICNDKASDALAQYSPLQQSTT